MVPLLIAPHGGMVDGQPVQRTFLTARSVEFDALLLAGAPRVGSDAVSGRDAKSGDPADSEGRVDPRVRLMIGEMFRHGKAIGGWGDAEVALVAAGCDPVDAGVVLGEDPASVLAEVIALLGAHRVWNRFPAMSG